MFEEEAVEVELDFAVANLEDSDELGYLLVRGLQSKGFCAVDMGFNEMLPKEALSDVESLEQAGRFSRPPDEILQGLLGEEGSGRIAELEWFDAEEDQRHEGRALQYLDSVLSEVQHDLQVPLPSALGFSAPYRTAGMLHEACMFPDGQVPDLSLEECQRWHAVFARNRLLLVIFIGPHEGRIALKPLEGAADVAVVRMLPGTMVVLRTDVLSHQLVALGERNYSFTCFLQEEPDSTVPGTPCAAKLMEWADNRMRELKARELDEAVIEEHRTSMPRHWRRLMNRRYFRGQHATVAGTALRNATTWQADLMSVIVPAGADLVQKVPDSRFDIESVYDPDPELYLQGKTVCRHGAFADGLELFDNRLFLISPSEAGAMDPQQRMILDAGYEAAFRAGLQKRNLMNSHGGVFIGMSYALDWAQVPKRDTGAFNAMSGASRVIPANRVSYVLGTKGPSTSMDSGEASALCAVSLGREGVSRADVGRKHCDFSLCVGINLELMAGRNWASYQELGMLSPALGGGRCFTFDSLANGIVPADCAGALVLKLFAEQIDGELVPCQKVEPKGLVASTSVLHCGRGASLTAPSGPAQQEAVAESLRWARLAPDDVDVCECHGTSLVLHDAVEVGALAKALTNADDAGAAAVSLGCLKSGFGSSKPAGGIASLLKLFGCGAVSTVAPNVHLNQLNPELSLLDLPVLYTSEMLGLNDPVSFSGVSSNGLGGVHAHAMLWRQADEVQGVQGDLFSQSPEYERVAFWPAGGGELPETHQPGDAYRIAGSWSGWDSAEEMQDEGDGVFSYIMTLGENRWELFQLWLDGNPDRALHPGQHRAPKSVAVHGPEDGRSEFAWLIDGREQLVQDENEEFYEMYNEDWGRHGDRYRIRLRIAGQWRTVDWEKIKGVGSQAQSQQFGRYYVIGDWNDWEMDCAEELLPVEDAPGVFRTTVTLRQDMVAFQIVRNRDWGQVLCPADEWEGGDVAAPVYGPEDSSVTQGCNWYLEGQYGDTFCIEFQRSTSAEEDCKSVTWHRA